MIDSKSTTTTGMMESIENYILGRLSQYEIDELWKKFLKEPEWLQFLEMETMVRSKVKRLN